jgi:L-ribulose-5-phosphate 3-epimerase
MPMPEPAIGIEVGDLRLPTKEAIAKASALGFSVIELPAVTGEVAPAALSSSGRRHLRRYVDGLGLSMAALGADVPGARLTDPAAVDLRIERTRAILELATDLRVGVVTASIGALTHPESGEPSPVAIEALARIGEHADMLGRDFAIRPSYDSAERLANVLDQLRCPAIKIGLDPAAMAMVGTNPLAVIERYADRIALVYARDGTAGGGQRSGRETRFGEGEVDLIGLFAALAGGDYTGAHILRRTDSANPVSDLTEGRRVLLAHLPPA